MLVLDAIKSIAYPLGREIGIRVASVKRRRVLESWGKWKRAALHSPTLARLWVGEGGPGLD